MSLEKIISEAIQGSIDVKTLVLQKLQKEILQAGLLCVDVYKNKGKILLCGNGGSSCDASHIAAELIVRFKSENNRIALPAISLSGDAAVITACANDNGYDQIFARQVEGLGKAGDLLIALSTSGNSNNINLAIEAARKNNMKTICLLGKTGGTAKGKSDLDIIIPSMDTARIQECHIMLGHVFCSIIEKELFGLD